ncbi:hypothetical protein [Proteus sp. NMG38-2]|uniref:hypothetical protein n=1 Tax=Proteus sp. NMG38-2 TaxID=2883107 RepID=UPI001D0B6A6C|nr:hypothetical protein [Proteus sp. NMG38-2]UDN36888.1 hypothetical protein LG402_04255 [Proteus sp. NMG38-2]
MKIQEILLIESINKEILSMLGMDITVFEFIFYAEENTFNIKKVINNRETLDDLSILKEFSLPERGGKYIFILIDDLYYKKNTKNK